MTSATPSSLAGMVGMWQLDPKNTTIEFHTTAHWGLSKVTGTIRALEGRGAVSDDGGVWGELVMDATSIDTKIKRRDKHLRSRSFFDVLKHPTLTFTASKVTSLPDGTVGVEGSLMIKDQSHPIEFVTTLTHTTDDRIAVSAETTIDRRQWGVSRTPMGAGVANRVVMVAQFLRP